MELLQVLREPIIPFKEYKPHSPLLPFSKVPTQFPRCAEDRDLGTAAIEDPQHAQAFFRRGNSLSFAIIVVRLRRAERSGKQKK